MNVKIDISMGVLQNLHKKLKPNEVIIPKHADIYKALMLTPQASVKVVIVGQDPYPRSEDATGLAFSVPPHRPIPASLSRIFQTLVLSGYQQPSTGDISPWARRGVLLLNKSLTTIEGKVNVHQGEWDGFIQNIIEVINRGENKVLWWLMGNEAKALKPFIRNGMLYETPHPSPRTGKKFLLPHFKTINNALVEEGIEPIDWTLL